MIEIGAEVVDAEDEKLINDAPDEGGEKAQAECEPVALPFGQRRAQEEEERAGYGEEEKRVHLRPPASAGRIP